jgi:hypothetical protein
LSPRGECPLLPPAPPSPPRPGRLAAAAPRTLSPRARTNAAAARPASLPLRARGRGACCRADVAGILRNVLESSSRRVPPGAIGRGLPRRSLIGVQISADPLAHGGVHG